MPGCKACFKGLNESNTDANPKRAQQHVQSDRVGGCEGKGMSNCQRAGVTIEMEKKRRKAWS
jgi:predicted metal-binding protein